MTTRNDGHTGLGAANVAAFSHLQMWFEAALALPVSERERWLAANVSDEAARDAVRRLLTADARAGFLDTPVGEQIGRLSAVEIKPEGLIGQRIGEFHLIRALGRGGMAAVFLGERVDRDFHQQAAVKLLQRGLYSELEQRLFQRERQVLATLDHPNVARLIDGGVTEAGIPYIVMEYVDGVPITDYVREHALDIRQRLRLFVEVCRAVEAAHRRLIVHRDIKPSNILVTKEGEAKLLDFGIAKLIEDEAVSATGTIGVFTPGYAAPEQKRAGAITTATDVYGLGVLLHELLTGRLPEDADGGPCRPSSLAGRQTGDADGVQSARIGDAKYTNEQWCRRLRGDLDNIVLKALDAEPERRYASAGVLADDIERHLDGRPVQAHPPTRWYRTFKFVQRHRGGVTVTAVLVLAIVIALGLALWQAQVAREEAGRMKTVRDFIVNLFDSARAHLPREQRLTPEVLVDQAQKLLTTSSQLDAATRNDVLRMLGEVALSQDDFAKALVLLDQAKQESAKSGDASVAQEAAVLHADALQRAGRDREAAQEIQGVLDTLRHKPSPTLLRALKVLAAAEIVIGEMENALARSKQAVTVAERIYQPDSVEILAVKMNLGEDLEQASRYSDAIAELDPVLARWRALHAIEDDRYIAGLSSFASAQVNNGNSGNAEATFRELLALKRRIYTEPHDSIAATMRDLAILVGRAGRTDEAKKLFAQALDMQQKVFGDTHVELVKTHGEIGVMFSRLQQYPEAEHEYLAAIETCSRIRSESEVCATAHNNFGMLRYRQQRYDDAKAEMSMALAMRKRLLGGDNPTIAVSLGTLANVAVKQKRFDQAIEFAVQGLAIMKRDGNGASRDEAMMHLIYANALQEAGRHHEALPEIEHALNDWQRVEPEGKAIHVNILTLKAQILRDLGEPDKAREAANEAISLNVDAKNLPAATKESLRKLSARQDIYPEVESTQQK
jgi:serine/threonine protein kinase/tetratricopeptide (TPR) repeat protein